MKQKIILLSIVFLSAFGFNSVIAQDPSFSQYFSSPLLINPANTGFIYGQQRITAHLRQQNWGGGTPFFTGSASYDAKISPQDRGSVWALGINALEDRAAEGLFKANSISVSAAYHAKLDKQLQHSLGIGFTVGYHNKRIDFSKGSFADQFTVEGFDPNIPTGETNLTMSSSTIDVSSGILYTYDGTNTNAFIGVAGFHLNKQKGNSLPVAVNSNGVRLAASGGISFKTTKGRIFLSSIFQTMNSANTYAFGGAYKFEIATEEKQVALYLGGFIGNASSYPYAAIQLNNLQIGLSYDILTGKANPNRRVTNNTELSLMYNIAGKNSDTKTVSKL
jgi:type IX secretion system PorP/SprF family membrane protein